MALFKSDTNSLESKELISKDLINALSTDSDAKLFVSSDIIK